MCEKRSAKALTSKEYARVFNTYTSDTNRSSNIMNGVINPIVDKYAGMSIDLMSVGAGTGWVEDEIIRHPDLLVKSLLAIEPNPQYVEELREKSAKWTDTVAEIDQSFFDEHYATAKKFDIILMIHSIYYADNPIEVILTAKSFLKPNGQIIVVARGSQSSVKLSAHLEEKVEILPMNSRRNIDSELIIDGLQKNNITVHSQDATDYHDVSDFIMKKDSLIRYDVISFHLNTKYEDLDEDLQDSLYKIVQENVLVTEGKRYMYCETSSYIIVDNI